MDKAQATVVSKIIEYESYVQSIKRTLERSLQSFKKVRL